MSSLVSLLPQRLQETMVGKFQLALDAIVTQMMDDQSDFTDQLNVATATWGLTYWESMLGITTNVDVTYEQRREVVISHLRGAGTSTVAAIQNVAESYDKGSVGVTEIYDEYRVLLTFLDEFGIPDNMADIQAAVAAVMPAHLAYEFVYLFATWASYADYTWNQLANYTWDEIRDGGML